MDLQTIFDNASAAARAERMKTSPQLSLGELILKLEAIGDKTLPVRFDFEYFHPTFFMSWRGVYAELAIGFTNEGAEPAVEKFLEMCRECVGKTFEGYKGGDFVMGKNTPIWVANVGNSANTGVVDVIDAGYQVILATAYCGD